jgi:hypothetical protein
MTKLFESSRYLSLAFGLLILVSPQQVLGYPYENPKRNWERNEPKDHNKANSGIGDKLIQKDVWSWQEYLVS